MLRFVRQKEGSEESNIVLTIVRATGVVTLIEEDKVGGTCLYYNRNSVVLPTKTLKAFQGVFYPSKTSFA
jgi:hypothetical protein